jgi:CrcB protein
MRILWIALGGGLGAVLRYVVSGLAHRLLGSGFPWGTFAVNVVGCLLIGALGAVSERLAWAPGLRSFVFIGMLGAFTTFSTFGLETFNLLRDGEYKLGILNVLGSNVLGIAAVVVGFMLARWLLAPPELGTP